MTLCRAYVNIDGTVRVVYPNVSKPLEGESEKQCYARMLQLTEDRDPELAALPHIDIDADTLPADRADRARWRVKGKRVVVEAD